MFYGADEGSFESTGFACNNSVRDSRYKLSKWSCESPGKPGFVKAFYLFNGDAPPTETVVRKNAGC